MTSKLTTQPDRTRQGIAIILASVTAMAFADAVVKLMSSDVTLLGMALVMTAGLLVAAAPAKSVKRASAAGD